MAIMTLKYQRVFIPTPLSLPSVSHSDLIPLCHLRLTLTLHINVQ